MTSEAQFKRPRFITVEGPPGVGKTELAKVLAKNFHAELILDPKENPFLQDFYEERPGAAFQAQFYFLQERFRRMEKLDSASNSNISVVSNYLFEKDRLYAYANLNDAELQLYEAYYKHFTNQVPTADLVIYLQARVKDLKKQVAVKKNRPRISLDYLKEVVKAYEHFFFHYKASSLLVIDTSGINFLDRNEDLQELLRRLQVPVWGTQYFLPLGSTSVD